MYQTKYALILLVGLTLLCGLASPAFAQDKYALLISAGQTNRDDNVLHSEYWYDLFLMYRMLIDAGFTHDRIFVLYGNGNDFASAHADYQTATVFPGVAQITDYPNGKAVINNMFNWLASGNITEGIPQLQNGDFLFYWWMGHGDTEFGMPACEYEASIENTGETVRDDEFAAYFARLPVCMVKAMCVMTCHSGGLIDDLEGLHTTLHTACSCSTLASSDLFDVWHGELSYHEACALWEQEPGGGAVASDTDGSGLVSIEEANDYAHANTLSSVTQISDYRGIAPIILIDNAQPAAGVPMTGVYSRDFEEDDGTEPSDYMTHVWYEGPDLWIRHAEDSDTEHQEPFFGIPNYVYARIHNINCMTLDVDVELSWCTVSAWSNPAAWNTIASFTAADLESGETRVVSAEWNPVPAPGKYCLHTVLNAPGDPENGDGRSFMDNNKVQINVTVDTVSWTCKKHLHWVLENGLGIKSVVNVVVDKLDLPTFAELEITIPKDLKFTKVIGGKVVDRDDGPVILASREAKTVTIQGVRLEPNARHDAVLSITVPKEVKSGQTMCLKVSERMKGAEVGGIIFNLKSVDQAVLMADLLKRSRFFFRELHKRFETGSAQKMTEIFGGAQKEFFMNQFETLPKTLADFPELQSHLVKELSGMMKKEDLARFGKHMAQSAKGLKAADWGAFTEHLEEGMHATVPLFLKQHGQ